MQYRVRLKTLEFSLLLTSALVAPATAYAGAALPSNGQYVAGQGTIAKKSNGLSIDQTSKTGIIDWTKFSVGKGKAVNFDNGDGATLNRVTGGNLSTIAGSLKASGSLYVINPEGMVVSGTGRVVTGGTFVGSSRDMTDSAFADGEHRFRGTSKGVVVNEGTITSAHGDVALIGSSAANSGTMSAQNGRASVTAGDRIYLAPAGSGSRILISGGSGNATNSGTIAAAQAQLNAAGGNVYALSGNNGGIIRATGTSTLAGHVWLTSNSGTTTLAGTVFARNADDAGGKIETSGQRLAIGRRVSIDTGRKGKWLVDPTNLTVGSSAAKTIATTLNKGTNVQLQTTASGSTGPGTSSKGARDIVIKSAIAWSKSSTFSLSAYHNVDIDAAITNTGKGVLSVRADNTGTGKGTINLPDGGKVNFTKSTGAVLFFYNPTNSAAPGTVNTTEYTVQKDFSKAVKVKKGDLFAAFMLVNNVYDLQNMQNVPNSSVADFALGKNINASATKTWNPATNPFNHEAYDAGFLPIDPSGYFGYFDGLGHTISNLYESVGYANNENGGLFGFVAASSLVTLVHLTNADIITGPNGGEVGILAGRNAGPISDSSATGTIKYLGEESVGGLIGYNDGGSISNTYAAVSINAVDAGQESAAGGLIGTNYGSVAASHATGNVSDQAANAYVGGLVGFNNALEGVGTITGSYATGNVTGGTSTEGGGASVGGLVGENLGTGQTENDIPPATTASSKLQPGEIMSSYATGKVTDTGQYAFIGGLVGYNDNDADLVLDYATGDVAGGGVDAIGGLVGYNDGDGSIVIEDYATGDVSGKSGNEIGGLAGYNAGELAGSYALGSVTAEGANAATAHQSSAGGLVGANEGTVIEGYAKGKVTVGSPSGGTNAYAGGLVGYEYGGTLNEVYSTGAVKGGKGSHIGGLTGSKGLSLTAAYWDTTTSGLTKSAEGKAMTTAQLKAGLPAGFNTTDWAIKKGKTFPYFVWAATAGAPL